MTDQRIFHIATPTFPEFRFEWHLGVKRVYLIRLGVQPLVGDPIAADIENEGAAHMAVLLFLRGYREGKAAQLLASGKAGHRDEISLPNIALGGARPAPLATVNGGRE